VNSSIRFAYPHNLIKIQYFFTKFLPQHHIGTPNSFTKPKTWIHGRNIDHITKP
jgi:hypothetical protein